MERHISKRKRIFSYQPNTNPSTIFARNYLNHLIPALKSIKQTTKPTSEINSSSSNHQSEFAKNVRHEVDMALAESANQEFSWTRSLKQRLRSNSISGSTEKREEEEEEEEEDEEEGIVVGRMRELRGLVPGGEEMDVEEMLTELGSYIACLELQTAVLKSLVESNANQF